MPQTQNNVVPEATKGPCRYCKEYGHELDDCAKLAAKIKRDEKNGIVRPTCTTCGRVGHTAEKCFSNTHKDGVSKIQKLDQKEPSINATSTPKKSKPQSGSSDLN